jgi:hypothetical protein
MPKPRLQSHAFHPAKMIQTLGNRRQPKYTKPDFVTKVPILFPCHARSCKIETRCTPAFCVPFHIKGAVEVFHAAITLLRLCAVICCMSYMRDSRVCERDRKVCAMCSKRQRRWGILSKESDVVLVQVSGYCVLPANEPRSSRQEARRGLPKPDLNSQAVVSSSRCRCSHCV